MNTIRTYCPINRIVNIIFWLWFIPINICLLIINIAHLQEGSFTLKWCSGRNFSEAIDFLLPLLRSNSILVGLILGCLCFTCLFLGIGMGNLGVFQGYLHLYPIKPVPMPKGTGFDRYRYRYTTRRWVCTQKMTNNLALASSVQVSIDTALQLCEDRKVILNGSGGQQWACWCDGWWLDIGVINKTCWHGGQCWSC